MKIIISFLLILNNYVSASEDKLKENKNKTFKDIECNLWIIEKKRVPVIGIKLKYNSSIPLDINWDENFGHVLWDGVFILVNETNKSDTSLLYIKTSNTYQARRSVNVNKGEKLSSILDFSKLPISLINKDLISKDANLRLYYKHIDINGTEKIYPISNKLNL
ncbi:MAG: Unknown protein [uncultured Sulfurovum sp.]|uniref:Uncharacterized protein n=1 Tax=uncultured Sulfurovum sp. TaxID=269237 RepID=A0A6S6SEA7_9BACT|nr:MAG: Unknown protein [uncultured Sulfurovum sp.]